MDSNFMNSTANRQRFAVWSLCTLIASSIVTFGVLNQLMLEERVCLLYVDNYHKDGESHTFIFESRSISCMQSVILGSFSIFSLLAVVIVRGFYMLQNIYPPKNILIVLNVLASCLATVGVYLATILLLGVVKTCSEFEKSGKSCNDVLGEGFFTQNGIYLIHLKNYKKIMITIVSAWVLALLWGIGAVKESYNLWKNEHTVSENIADEAVPLLANYEA
ncbi:hypothetical protein BC833DRAFT_623987 [Globomyces pollinis-pini]|nr:hypothetical protein BC833DRAFT_623987 [Globomyces pollinis-pini]